MLAAEIAPQRRRQQQRLILQAPRLADEDEGKRTGIRHAFPGQISHSDRATSGLGNIPMNRRLWALFKSHFETEPAKKHPRIASGGLRFFYFCSRSMPGGFATQPEFTGSTGGGHVLRVLARG